MVDGAAKRQRRQEGASDMSSEVHRDRGPCANESDLALAYAHCRAITRTRARNFYYGIRLSREPHRSAIYAVYAWMRLADDLVDSADAAELATLEQRIIAFRDATDQALQGRPAADSPLWPALADTARRFNLPAEHFHEMLEGQLDDARRTTYDTYEQLLQYCQRVASTVGLICIEIWGYRDPAARDYAAERGVAFQLTNILRDMAEDDAIGRTYLPREDFARFDVTLDDLRTWNKPDACRSVLEATIERAEAAYEQSAPLDQLVHPRGRPTLWAMTSIYRGLLEKIKADPQRVMLGRRVRLSALHKGAIALRAKWLARFMGEAGDLGQREAGVSENATA
jgi:phytoene synthase